MTEQLLIQQVKHMIADTVYYIADDVIHKMLMSVIC